MSEGADFVILNKGPFLKEALSVLDDVIGRMEEDQTKNPHFPGPEKRGGIQGKPYGSEPFFVSQGP